MNCQILIQNGPLAYAPVAQEGIEWSTVRKGSPGKLTFAVINDAALNIQEGNAVQFNVDGKPVFFGYIFIKSRDKDNLLKITCYDQLRYFKNKDTYAYIGKKASEVLQMVCNDFNLKTGIVEDTEYIIAKKSEPNKTLFDIVQNALDDTLLNIKKLYCLYDDYGKITLKNIGSMFVNLLIDEETGQNFEYTSSIDGDTYNKIKLFYEGGESGIRDIYIAQDGDHMNDWGVLQFYDTLKEGENGTSKVEALLGLYNKKTRNLKVSDAFGDIRVRAGSAPLIKLHLGDVTVNNFMVCDSVTHKFSNNEHTMDLSLIGGDFIV